MTGTRVAYLATKPADQRNEAEKNELFAWWLVPRISRTGTLSANWPRSNRSRARSKPAARSRTCMQERSEPAMAYVLFRGEYDKRGDQVQPDTPGSPAADAAGLPRNRLGFAQWLLRPEHPLTARVTVNRFWQELFGAGIVKTSEDFGIIGELLRIRNCSTGWRSNSARAAGM